MITVLSRIAHPARRLSPWRLIAALVALRRQRRALGRLEDHLLADIGLTPDRARAEAARPVWDVPPTWRL